MKPRGLSLLLAVASATFAAGCATTERTATAPAAVAKRDADAIFFVNGLS